MVAKYWFSRDRDYSLANTIAVKNFFGGEVTKRELQTDIVVEKERRNDQIPHQQRDLNLGSGTWQ